MQGLKKFKSHASFLRKLLKMCYTKMRKLTKKEEDTGNRKAEAGEKQRKSQDPVKAGPCMRQWASSGEDHQGKLQLLARLQEMHLQKCLHVCR